MIMWYMLLSFLFKLRLNVSLFITYTIILLYEYVIGKFCSRTHDNDKGLGIIFTGLSEILV